MRVLWLCNIMLPMVAEHLNREASNKEGWLTGLANRVLLAEHTIDLELAVCFPVEEVLDSLNEKIIVQPVKKTETVKYLHAYGFYEDLRNPHIYDSSLEEKLQKIISDFKPDVVHIFGTEYPHTLALTRAFHRPERTLIGIQGLCSVYANHYMADIPHYVQKRKTLRDLLRRDSIEEQQIKFVLRGENEKEALANVNHITGRTAWDKKYAAEFSPEAKYHFMNETLRSNFYEGKWSLENCEKHSLFVSQGDYPIKGLHYILQAMKDLTPIYPDMKLYVAGNSICNYKTLKDKLKISSYAKYILDLINENHLENHVEFLGRLNADEMKQRYLKSHIFVCPSSIENSPNSVGEAMILGVPVVSADVGGISSIFEGVLYEAGNINELKESIMRMWTHEDDIEIYSEEEIARAKTTHDGDVNFERLIEIYQEIAENTRTVAFVSNYINHHQIPFSNAMYEKYGNNYCFIQTEPMEAERIQMGWDARDIPVYVKKYYEEPKNCQRLIDTCDVVIYGGTDEEQYIKSRLNKGKFTLRYSESIYKTGRWKAISPRGLKKKHEDHTKYSDKPVYLLCAGAYVAGDYDIIRAYPNKKLKWGYFPQMREYDIDTLMQEKQNANPGNVDFNKKVRIVWAARMIDWKHPETVLKLAERLKKQGEDFEITMIGDGKLREKIIAEAEKRKIADVIKFTGALPPDKVREQMEQAEIFLATSDRQEGWGAVINEAMNSGCAVVANRAMGAAPYLIQSGRNGFLYQNGNMGELEQMVQELLHDSKLRQQVGFEAVNTIMSEWNAKKAADNLNAFLDYGMVQENGLCSRA